MHRNIFNIDIIAGARPNFIKIAPLIHELRLHSEFKWRLIHTGQHYDKRMSDDFFRELMLPKPDKNLHVGSGTQAEQTAGIMVAYELFLKQTFLPDICIVVGDVTSTMACAIVSKKAQVKVAHIEAGLRSGDMSMPEEINRIITDSITDYFFTTSLQANENLLKTGVNPNQLFFVGNIMIDTLKRFEKQFYAPKLWDKHHLKSKEYIVLTLHRPSNVDDTKNLFHILQQVNEQVGDYKVIYPVHPRVAEQLKHSEQQYPQVIMSDALPYLEFNFLVKHAKAVITDSGGITEEATIFDVPCLTLRSNTERPETIIHGTNHLIKDFPADFIKAMQLITNDQWKSSNIPKKWDGNTAKRILSGLKKIVHIE